MVREEFRIAKKINEGEVPGDIIGCVQEAADLCPVQIIFVTL